MPGRPRAPRTAAQIASDQRMRQSILDNKARALANRKVITANTRSVANSHIRNIQDEVKRRCSEAKLEGIREIANQQKQRDDILKSLQKTRKPRRNARPTPSGRMPTPAELGLPGFTGGFNARVSKQAFPNRHTVPRQQFPRRQAVSLPHTRNRKRQQRGGFPPLIAALPAIAAALGVTSGLAGTAAGIAKTVGNVREAQHARRRRGGCTPVRGGSPRTAIKKAVKVIRAATAFANSPRGQRLIKGAKTGIKVARKVRAIHQAQGGFVGLGPSMRGNNPGRVVRSINAKGKRQVGNRHVRAIKRSLTM